MRHRNGLAVSADRYQSLYRQKLENLVPKRINGRRTYEQIIKIRPGQKAIIASGYAKTKEVDIAQELGAGKYIKKPYTLTKVGLAVKEEMEK